MFGNAHNWRSLIRTFAMFRRPLDVLSAIAAKRAPGAVTVRTPTGDTTIELRNFESLKTCFSVFCRRDYPIAADEPHLFVDVGANIGVAAIFFLTRHSANRVICYEPDANNLSYLRRNLAQFGERAEIVAQAVAAQPGNGTLFRSADGKYTSLVESEAAVDTEAVDIAAFSAVLDDAMAATPEDVVVKIDIEGLETALVRAVDFADYPRISRLIVESLECSELIGRKHHRAVRNGYVEDLAFA